MRKAIFRIAVTLCLVAVLVIAAIWLVEIYPRHNSHPPLKLAKGTHTLVGLTALEFLRTRHGFGDGSDLGRTYAQHVFITQMVNKLKSAGTLTNPSQM